MKNKDFPIEVYHFVTNMNTNGNSSGIKKYRGDIYNYCQLEGNNYIFDIHKLKKIGVTIPEHIKEVKWSKDRLDWYAYELTQMGVDAFAEILNNLNRNIKKRELIYNSIKF